MLIQSLLFAVGISFLYFGADWFVKGSSRIASITRITPLVIGLTVVAFGTSAPELMVSLVAALRKEPDITLGNVIGSNIANIGLVLGVSALISNLHCQVRTIRREIPMMILSSLLLLILAMDGEITASNGVLLVSGIVLFIFYSYRSMRGERPIITEEVRGEDDQLVGTGEWRLPRVVLLTVIGLCFLLLGAHLILESAVCIADSLGGIRKLIVLSMGAGGTSRT